MADAGKVAILPRGLWNPDTVYEPLDLVYYNNNSFVALKESVGVTPVDGDTWMLSLSGISQETIDAILNGTQRVGDSAKLGGKEPSEYALDTDLANYLPLDGNTPMTGALEVRNGMGGLDASTWATETYCRDSADNPDNYRSLRVYNCAHQPLAQALGLYESTTNTLATVLHTGNSAKVAIQSTAPTDGLWVDTANKKVKVLIDGAWTAMA